MKDSYQREHAYRSWPVVLALLIVTIFFVIAGMLLIVQSPIRQADAIVVIGGDHKWARIHKAVELYQQGYASLLIISSGTKVQEGGEWVLEAEVMRRQALALGLPDHAIILETVSNTTVENAVFVDRLCRSLGLQSVLLVTSPYHSRRANVIFHDRMSPSVAVFIQPSTDAEFCALSWWLKADERSVVLSEYWKMLAYLATRK